MNAQLIKLKDGKIVVVNFVEIKEGDYFLFQCTKADETNHWKNGMIQKCKNVIDFEIYDERGDVEQYSSVCDYECKKVIAGHDSLPAISNIDKVFELWKLAKDEKEWKLLYQILIDARPSICVHEQSLKNLFEISRIDYYSAKFCIELVKWALLNYPDGNYNDYSDDGWKKLLEFYQLSLIPESLQIEWDENKNEILKVK